METLLKDLRYGARTLLRSRGLAVVAVLTLGLGIGAATTIFSVVNGVLLRPLPFHEPARVVQVWQINAEGNQSNVSDANFADLREQNRSFSALAQFASRSVAVSGGSAPARVIAASVSRDFFDALGIRPALGRTFVEQEQEAGASPAAIVSHGYWQTYLGGNPDLSAHTLMAGGQPFAVVGVMPPGFDFPGGVSAWVPRELEPPLPSRTAHNWRVVGRLRQEVTLAQARDDVSALAHRLKAQYGDDTWMSDAAVVPLHEQIVGRVRPVLLVLLGAAAFLLLIACGNITNLLLARAASRQKELAVRLALGAGRRRLVQQFLAEALVLALAAGALAVLLAIWGVQALRNLAPANLPRLDMVSVSWPVLGFALGISLLTAIVLGATAAVRAARQDVRASLAESQRGESGGAARDRVRSVLVTSQVALTVVLLAGAVLLGRSFLRLLAVDPGFRTGSAVVMDLTLPEPDDAAARFRLARLHDAMTARLSNLPGIREVGGANSFPLGGNHSNGTFLILNRPDEVSNFDDFGRIARDETRSGYAEYRAATAGYFRAMDIPLVRGRLFDDRDRPDTPHAAVISESLARAEWPGGDPLGKIIQFGNMDGDLTPFTIVGIVGDVRERSLEAEPRPTFYGNARQRIGSTSRFTYVMHGSADPASTIPLAREIVRELAPDVPPRFRTVEEVLSAALAERRFSMLLLGLFGATALILTALGIYGLISYVVVQRTRELGIRMALGAQKGQVLRLVVRQGATLAAIGVAVGVLAALMATRLIATMLYGISATDPLTIAGVSFGLMGIALLASYLPARRAARVDPMVALRTE